ncbi:MAG: hypothetical protein Q9160_000888 [Pyrenula sp. 1 TL-2023]
MDHGVVAIGHDLRQRLLQDIRELKEKPYPNIDFHTYESDIRKACLILTPEAWPPMHLTVNFGYDYPLHAPEITMQSHISHPNVFDSYICASILNTDEGYTPAYTLKGIAIQMLSFFRSDKIDQSYGAKHLDVYRQRSQKSAKHDNYRCTNCGFSCSSNSTPPTAPSQSSVSVAEPLLTNDRHPIDSLPNELLLLICNWLDDEELLIFARSWSRIGQVITAHSLIRTRELQCFCLKKGFGDTQLGIGVNVCGRGRQRILESEFDLLSLDAFSTHSVRQSVQGLPFTYWLPLPLTEKHWNKVKGNVEYRLTLIQKGDELPLETLHFGANVPINVIYHFMNDVVVKLNKQADEVLTNPSYSYNSSLDHSAGPKSTLQHASEKAIDSYFNLFHLLLCLIENHPGIVDDANQQIQEFLNGATSKSVIPNLGHLLIALLISSSHVTNSLLKLVVKEAITRNVVWMLNSKPELAYLECDEISRYRLHHTYCASKTSYRLLMFLNLFRTTVRPDPTKPLASLRQELFKRYGAPPSGTAAQFAKKVKQYHEIDSFPAFLSAMGLEPPQASVFTTWLRQSVKDSMEKGYSAWDIQQGEALWLRQQKESTVGVQEGLEPKTLSSGSARQINFFPNKEQNRGGRRRRGR